MTGDEQAQESLVRDVLEGRLSYDAVDSTTQALVRDAWQEGIDARLVNLNLEPELVARGMPWTEVDADGQAIRRTPEDGQERQVAEHRRKLLATPFLDVKALRAMRGDEAVEVTEAWVVDQRDRNRLLVVPADGEAVMPGFQFDDAGALLDDIVSLIEPLLSVGVGPWQTWTWLTSPTALLSGLVPLEAAADPATSTRAGLAVRLLAGRVRQTRRAQGHA